VLLLWVIAVVILGGVVLAALGRSDVMASFPSDSSPMDLRGVSAVEIAMLRLPLALWGYNAQVTDEVLQQIAQAVSERDVEIATLRRELEELRAAERAAQEHTQAVLGHDEEQVPGAQRRSS
jgi:hypothetical protein